MNEQATQQILQHLKTIKDRVTREEELYELRGTQLERRSQNTTSTFSDMSNALSLITEARELTRNLYSTFTAAVLSLDELCRPLLAQDPAASAIKEIADYCKYLNSEAGSLGANFNANVNGSSMGDIANTRFTVAPEALSIESFWQAKYDATPEALEAAERAEKMRRLMAERRKEQAAQQAKEAEAIAQNNTRLKANKKALQQRCDAAIKEYTTALAAEVEATLANLRKEQEAQDIQRRTEIAVLQKELVSCGLFDFSKKKALKEQIQIKQSLTGPAYIDEVVRTMRNEYEAAARDASQTYSKKLESHLAACYSTGKTYKRNPTGNETPTQMANDSVKMEILRTLGEAGRPLTVTEIMEKNSVLEDLSSTRVSAILRQLVHSDTVIRTEEKRRAYFAYNGNVENDLVVEIIENTTLANGPLPTPLAPAHVIYQTDKQLAEEL